MELLINLIIIFVIFAAILKRFKEVAKKGEELGSSPPAAPEVEPEIVGRKVDVPRKEPGPGQVLKKLFEELGEVTLERPPEQAEPKDIMKQTTVLRGDVLEQPWELPEQIVEESVQPSEIIQPPVSYSKAAVSKEKPVSRFQLSFSGSEVVRGIVMSEILGPPVSERRDQG